MTPITLRRLNDNPLWLLWAYLLLIALAELLVALIHLHPRFGVILHALLLVGLLIHAALGQDAKIRDLTLALTLAPLIRLLSTSLPFTRFAQPVWYPIVVTPLLIATWIIIRQLGVLRPALGLRSGNLVLQLMLMGGGLGLGAIEYAILQPPAMVADFSWQIVVLAALSLIIFTGFAEEIIFRGLLQSLAIPVLGSWALIYVSLLFAALHIGYLSVTDVIFVFAVGLLFAYIVYWSGSILGVTLAHGLTNIALFLLMPYLAEHATARTQTIATGLIWAASVLGLIAIGVIIWHARRDNRLRLQVAHAAPGDRSGRQAHRSLSQSLVPHVVAIGSELKRQLALRRSWSWSGVLLLLTLFSGILIGYSTTVLLIDRRSANVGALPPSRVSNDAAVTATPSHGSAVAVLGATVATSTNTPTVILTPEPEQTALATSVPTNTAAPFAREDRPSPILSPTAADPTPSVTPSTDGTHMAEDIELERFVEDTFNSPTSGWPDRITDTSGAQYIDGQYHLTLHGQTSISVSTVLPIENYRLSVDMAIMEGSAGMMFLSAAPATFYSIIINTEGSYAIQKLQQDANTLTNVVDWTEHAALPYGAGIVHRLRVERQGQAVIFFANDQLLTTFTIPAGEVTNQYGFVLTSQTDQGKAVFDNLVGEHLPDS